MEKPVIIFGANGLGRAALELFIDNEVVVYGFLDDNTDLHDTTLQDVRVLGSTTDDGYLKLIGHKCEAFIATDDNSVRKTLVQMLNTRRKMMPVNAIHKFARIAGSAYLEHGNFINDSVIIGTYARVGSHNILNSGSIVEYDAKVGNFVQLGAGSIIGQGAEIDDEAFIGAGATIVAGVKIGKRARVGAGSVVVANVEDDETVFGNPASTVKV